jgi:hypothetical protein
MANVILTFKKNKLYSGQGGGSPLLTIKKNKVYPGHGEGAFNAITPLLTIKKNKVYPGHGGGTFSVVTPLLTIKKNKVYPGHAGGMFEASYPIVTVKKNKVYSGHGEKLFLIIKGNKVHQIGNSSSLGMKTEEFVGALIASGTVKISDGGCFIATATMGDYDHPVVLELREFRDQYLLERNWGKKFTECYYKFGPYPAKVISQSNLLKKISYIFIVKPLSFIVKKIMNNMKSTQD